MKWKDYAPRPGTKNCHQGSTPEHPFTMDTTDLFHYTLYLHVPQWVPHFGLEWHQNRLRERVPTHVRDCSNCTQQYDQYAALVRQYTPEQLFDIGKRACWFPSPAAMRTYIDTLVEQHRADGTILISETRERERYQIRFANSIWEYINPHQRYRWPLPTRQQAAPMPGASTAEPHPPTA